jgi:hypothetical protein
VRVRTIATCLALLLSGATVARAQEAGGEERRANEPRVPLTEQATAFDAAGRTALGARLRTLALSGTLDAPVRNARIVIENRSGLFYTYVSGWATFYDGEGVRCGEGLWKLEALAPGEAAEADMPGLRITCAPATWRLVANNLLTRTGDVAKPSGSVTSMQPAVSPADARPLPPLEINVNGKTLPIQPGNPLEITVGRERVRIVVNTAP